MIRFLNTVAALGIMLALSPELAHAANPLKVDRQIGKEPAYKTKSPKYGLLVFGLEANARAWLVQDGDTLHVDRNGNGDLTDPGEAIAAQKPREGVIPEEGTFTFEVGELTAGGKTHKGFTVFVSPLARYAGTDIGQHPDAKAALAKDPKVTIALVRGDVDVPGLKGGGIDGRVSFTAGFHDANGPLRFADKPADAPVIHLGGPLEVTFYGTPPALRVGRTSEFYLVVGTPGIGPGTFAMVQFADTIPEDAYPVAELTCQPAKPGAPPVKAKYELKQRC